MSSQVFPALIGLKWDVVKAPLFNTHVQRSMSAREIRISMQQYPLWNFRLSYDVLRDDTAYNELNKLRTLFLNMRGRWDSFLYQDPTDYAVTAQQFATGNGATQFQLTRTLVGNAANYTEPVQNVLGTPVIMSNGVPVANSVSNIGVVTLNSASAVGANLSWTGQFLFRCRFEEDTAEFNNFMYRLWNLKEIGFVGAPGNKV